MTRAGKMVERRTDTLVIFIHGFLGSPGQFDDLAEAVSASGASALSLSLPGHGGTAREFAAARCSGWESCVLGEIERCSEKYTRIFLVGHSLGCLLALAACAVCGGRVAGAFLIYPALKIYYLNPRANIARIRLFLSPKYAERAEAYRRASGMESALGGGAYLIRPYIEFKKAAARAKRALGDVRVPVFAVFSSGDETVSLSGEKLLSRGLVNAEYGAMRLSESMHAWFEDGERGEITKALLGFIA
jgi:carboxylesterase